MSDRPPRILVVDDRPENVRLLEAVLIPRGYDVLTASSGAEALSTVESHHPDLVLCDVVMPGIDGYEVCRRVRADPSTAHLPIVMVTASGEQEKLKALDAGADDFIAKPFDHFELLARVRSLLRLKEYHDTIERQAAQLSRFLSPQIARLVASKDGERLLEGHRREIAVVVCDLRGFTSFSETTEPEEVMTVLREYQAAVGELVVRFEGTLEHFEGDGLMAYFNDPVPCPDGPLRAVRMAVAMRDRVHALATGWHRRGHDLGFGVGVAVGYATLGRMGFEGRYDYGAVGGVVNMAHRFCDDAQPGQIIITQRVLAAVDDHVEVQSVGDLVPKGASRPLAAYNVIALR